MVFRVAKVELLATLTKLNLVSTRIGREKTLACVTSFGPVNLLYNLLGPNDVTHGSVLSLLITDFPSTTRLTSPTEGTDFALDSSHYRVFVFLLINLSLQNQKYK